MFDPRELAAVLAGLRLIQCHANDGYTEEPIADVATNGGTLTPLDATEIDALCERLNTTNPEDQLVDLLCLIEPDAIERAFAKAPSGCFKLDFSDDALDGLDRDILFRLLDPRDVTVEVGTCTIAEAKTKAGAFIEAQASEGLAGAIEFTGALPAAKDQRRRLPARR